MIDEVYKAMVKDILRSYLIGLLEVDEFIGCMTNAKGLTYKHNGRRPTFTVEIGDNRISLLIEDRTNKAMERVDKAVRHLADYLGKSNAEVHNGRENSTKHHSGRFYRQK